MQRIFLVIPSSRVAERQNTIKTRRLRVFISFCVSFLLASFAAIFLAKKPDNQKKLELENLVQDQLISAASILKKRAERSSNQIWIQHTQPVTYTTVRPDEGLHRGPRGANPLHQLDSAELYKKSDSFQSHSPTINFDSLRFLSPDKAKSQVCTFCPPFGFVPRTHSG